MLPVTLQFPFGVSREPSVEARCSTKRQSRELYRTDGRIDER